MGCRGPVLSADARGATTPLAATNVERSLRGNCSSAHAARPPLPGDVLKPVRAEYMARHLRVRDLYLSVASARNWLIVRVGHCAGKRSHDSGKALSALEISEQTEIERFEHRPHDGTLIRWVRPLSGVIPHPCNRPTQDGRVKCGISSKADVAHAIASRPDLRLTLSNYRGNVFCMTIAQSKITAQGQISVPAEVRKKLGVGPGSVLEWDESNDQVVVRRAGRHSSMDIHAVLFADRKPENVANVSVKEGIRNYLRKKHAGR